MMNNNTATATAPPHTFGIRETLPTDAVPAWRFLEVPITYSEAQVFTGLKSVDGRPDLVMRALMLRYIYGGEEVRKTMLGEGVTR